MRLSLILPHINFLPLLSSSTSSSICQLYSVIRTISIISPPDSPDYQALWLGSEHRNQLLAADNERLEVTVVEEQRRREEE